LRFGRKAAQRKLREASQALRDKTDQRRELLTLQEELQKCLRITTGLRDRKHSQLSDTLKVLDQFRAKGKVTEDSGGFYYETVDKAFPHLLKLTTTDRDLQQFILTSQASAATDAGIKAILGATSSDVHALAEKCLGPAPIPGAWPAAIKRNPQHTFLVLPPMPRALGEALRKSVRERASTWHVVFADSCSLGINAVRINVFFPRTAQELIPGFLWSELQKLSQSELKVLHVLDGQASKDSDLNAEEGAK
jgi:hypothetical protein